MPAAGARAAAKAAGEITYFTGKPCAHGHVAPRLVNGGCTDCRTTRPRTRNLEQAREYTQQYRVANREEVRRKGRERRAKNPERHVQWCREWRAKHPDRARASVQAWIDRNPERRREIKTGWEAANPDRRAINEQRRRARKLGTKNDLTAADVLEIRGLQGGRCAICTDNAKLTIDHIQPLALKGEHTRRNIQLVCQPCNSRKHAKDPIVFACEEGRLL